MSHGWQAIGHQDNAEDCLYEALRLEPEQVSVMDCLQLGDVLWQQGEVEVTVKAYQQAAELSRVS